LQDPRSIFPIQWPSIFNPDETPESIIGLIPWEYQGPKPTDEKPKQKSFAKKVWSCLFPLNPKGEVKRS
jgi:hypothetical protein